MEEKKGKNVFLKNLSLIISISSLVVSICSCFQTQEIQNENIALQEKYNTLSTYGMTLNYQLDISDEDGSLLVNDYELSKGQIDIIPKTGGIEKVYAIHYYKDNVKAILPIELYSNQIENSYDAQQLFYRLNEYNIDIIAESQDSYYGTLYIIIKDYQNNYYTNMIVYEFDKTNLSDVQTRIYSEVDLLHLSNEEINVLPSVDRNQLNEYQSLIKKIEAIVQ